MALYELTSGKDFVKLGDEVFSKYTEVPKNPFSFNKWLNLHASDYSVKFYRGNDTVLPRVLNKGLHENFGSKITLRLNAALYNTFIKANFPRETYFAISRSGKRWNTFAPRMVNLALENKHLIDQAIKDRTINLIPLMLEFEEDPQQLRKRFGKGLWKQLAHTSKTRMKHLAPLLKESTELISMRTGILPLVSSYYMHSREIKWCLLTAAKIAPRIKDFDSTVDIVRDTMRMAERAGVEVNHDWSWRRWNEEHDRLSWDVARKGYSETKFAEDCVFTQGGYTFTLLTSQADIAAEGMQMRHCVASYAFCASKGTYAVFKIEGKERATLGLNITPTLEVVNLKPNRVLHASLQQCYGPRNQPISSELHDTLPDIVRKYDDLIRHGNRWTPSASNESPCAVVDNEWERVRVYF
jgi:hypothetical protein